MAKIERFEDMLSWQKARELTRHVYLLSKQGDFARDFGVARANAQRHGFHHVKHRRKVSNVAVTRSLSSSSPLPKACGEVRSQLYVALDQSYISQAEFNNLHTGTVEVGRLVSGFMGYLQKSDLRGNKFKRA